MRFNVPHMRGTLNHIFHERRQKSDRIIYPETLFQVAIDMISKFWQSYENGFSNDSHKMVGKGTALSLITIGENRVKLSLFA